MRRFVFSRNIKTDAFTRRLLLVAVVGTLALGACGGGDNTSSTSAPQSQASATPVSGSPSPASAPPIPASDPSSPATANSLELLWDPVTASDLAGYRVYHGTSRGTYSQALGQGLDAGNSTSYRVNNLQKGVTYYFVVTSYDFAGNESGYSTELSKLIE